MSSLLLDSRALASRTLLDIVVLYIVNKSDCDERIRCSLYEYVHLFLFKTQYQTFSIRHRLQSVERIEWKIAVYKLK